MISYGKCISCSLHDLEPDLSRRLDRLVHIGIDETRYCKGYKYITVIVNHDTNTVVWAADGHGKAVLSKFYGQLTDKQKASIKVVTGDGARWIWSIWYVRIAGYHFLAESRGIDERSDTQKEWSFLPTETTEEPKMIKSFRINNLY